MIRKFPKHHYADDKIYDALSLLMKEREYKDITIADIARKAGLARMTFYRYYPDKDTVLLKRFVQVLSTIYSDRSTDPAEKMAESWVEIIRIMKDEPVGQLLKDADLFDKAFVIIKNYFLNEYPAFNCIDTKNEKNRMVLYRYLGEMFGCLMYCADNQDDSNDTLIAMHLADVMKEIGSYS